MRELLPHLDRWRQEGRRAATARVVAVEGSGPQGPGAAMAVADDGEIVGSVSAGCVEGAVVEVALAAIERGERGLHTFGYSDDEAFAVGLTCGGTLHLYVEPHDPAAAGGLRSALAAGRPVTLATAVAGPDPGATLLVDPTGGVEGSLGHPALDRDVAADAVAALASGRAGLRRYPHPAGAEVACFLEPFVPLPRLLVFGATDLALALVRVAKVLGHHVTVCDARPAFATPVRFPEADEVVVDWPHRLVEAVGPGLTGRDAVCVLTHDHKFDVPAIAAALGTGAGYVGALGSRRTHADRLARLRAAGVGDGALARLHAPIGLDLGARTPEEIAVAICAEIIAVRAGRADVRSLRTTEGPIHG